MSVDRAEQIAGIVARRQPLADRLEQVRRHLGSLNTALNSMSLLRGQLLAQVTDETVKDRLLGIDLDSLKQGVAEATQLVSRYHARFARKTLNIGVVGLARQGKSQLLRSLSGLEDDAIPAGRFGHCTGTRSMICHNPAVEPHGEIYCYSEAEFVQDVLSAYYGEPLGISPQPISLNDFKHNPLPEKLPADKQDSLSAHLKFEYLKRYKEHLYDYRALLSRPSPFRVPLSEVREYVAQDDIDGKRIFYSFLAVREARILCEFPHANLGQIALVDMPGLGDTGLGAEKRLIHTLGHDVDAILFIKKPSGLGAVWDRQEIDLYDLARGALPELPLELWAFLVMNHVNSSSPDDANYENCRRLLETKSHNMRFADTMIADCSDASEADRVVLQQVLTYLAGNLERLDQLYTHSCMERLQSIQNRVNAEMLKARDALGKFVDPVQSEFSVFIQLFEETEKKLASGLENKLKALREHRNEPNAAFYQSVLEAKEKCRQDTAIPSIAEIEETANLYKSYQVACHYHLNFVRTHLTRHFESLEAGLSTSLDAIKAQIAEVLISEDRGRLTRLSSRTGVEFLRELTAMLEEYSTVLHPAFAMFTDFRLSYQGFLYYRLRRHLDCLTPDGGQAQIGPVPSAQEVRDILIAMQKIAMEGLKNEFEDWPIEMNQVAFAIGEEFVDRILRSREARNEWLSFYMENRAQIWPESFAQLSVNNRLRRLWLEAIDKVAVNSQSILLTSY